MSRRVVPARDQVQMLSPWLRTAKKPEPSDLICPNGACGTVKPGGDDHDGDYSCPGCGSNMDYNLKGHSTKKLVREYERSGEDYGMALSEELHDRHADGDSAAGRALSDYGDDEDDEGWDEDGSAEYGEEPCQDCDGSGVKFLDNESMETDDEDLEKLVGEYMDANGEVSHVRHCPTCGGHGDLDSAWENDGEPGRGQKWMQWQRGEAEHPDCGSTHVPIRDMPKKTPGRPHTRDQVDDKHPALQDFNRLPTGSSTDYYSWMHEHTPFYDWPQFSHESVDSFMEDAPEYMTESCADDAIHDWIDEQESKGWPSWRGDLRRFPGTPGHEYEVPPEADPTKNRNLLSHRTAGLIRRAGDGLSWEDTMAHIDRVLAEGEQEPEQPPSTAHPPLPGWTHVADSDGNNWFLDHHSGLTGHVEDADPGGRATWSVYESATEPPVAHGDEDGMTPGAAMHQAQQWIEDNHHLAGTGELDLP